MSILQLIIALTIAATLSLLGVSSYQDWRTQKTLEQSIDLLSQQIELAHTLNITRGEAIYLCASKDLTQCDPSWHGTLILFTSTAPPHIDKILSSASLDPAITLTKGGNFNNHDYIRFMSTGEMVYNGRIELSLAQQNRCLSLSKTGITKEIACQNQAAAG